jgi:hypothetical protein
VARQSHVLEKHQTVALPNTAAPRVVEAFIAELAKVRCLDHAVARYAAGWCTTINDLPMRPGLILGTATAVRAHEVLTTDDRLASLDWERRTTFAKRAAR